MDWASGIGSLIGGASSLFGSIYSADQNYDAVMNTNALNERNFLKAQANEQKRFTDSLIENRFLTDLAYKRSIEQRDYENWYNSPEQQVERYRQAGLNPYLMMAGQNAMGSVQVGQAPVGSPPSGYHAPAPPLMQAPLIPDLGAAIGRSVQGVADILLRSQDMSYKRMSTLTDVMNTLASNKDISPDTKDKILKLCLDRVMYSDDQNQRRQNLIADAELHQLENTIVLQEAQKAIAEESNEAKRKEWQYLAKRYPKDLERISQEILGIIRRNDMLDDEGRFKKSSADLIENEVSKMERENDLWNGDFSLRSFVELILKAFSGNAILGLIGKMM